MLHDSQTLRGNIKFVALPSYIGICMLKHFNAFKGGYQYVFCLKGRGGGQTQNLNFFVCHFGNNL